MEENKSDPETAGTSKPADPEPSKAEPAASPDGRPTPEERYWALGAHLSGLVISFIGPLVVWLVKKEESAFIEDQAKEALNFQILLFAGFLVSSMLLCLVIGWFLIPILLLIEVVLCVIAAIKSNEGELYRYPEFLPRIIK